MEKQVYISEEERGTCKKVADAFAELYEMESGYDGIFMSLTKEKLIMQKRRG